VLIPDTSLARSGARVMLVDADPARRERRDGVSATSE
jgi:hypothetical protein